MTTLRLIFWDQLSTTISCLRGVDKKNDIVVLLELEEECTYVKHHKKKLIFLLSAMRHFAAELIQQGYQVHYVRLDDCDNTQTLSGELHRLMRALVAHKWVTTIPGDYRLYALLTDVGKQLGVELEILEDDRYLATHAMFQQWAKNKKSLRMEFFYREMRRKYHILMYDTLPEGGKWNFDNENRHFPKTAITIPTPYKQTVDDITQEVIALVQRHFMDHFGDTTPFHYAVTRKEALRALKAFIQDRLPHFGDYQDVMMQNQPWLFHSHISFYLNVGLLNPLECIKAAETAYYQGLVPLASAEGFIRQILGWREFVRGIYWLKMPAYRTSNYFQAKRPLPAFYWTGDTEMNCIKQCVRDTQANAYAHHIQRLMVLGNFALLAGIDPDEVNEWYLLVYADAHEWVELPNVTGMILYADGGYLASKPYIASGSYINKMSDYCQHCRYKVTLKAGPNACPFNYLYWHFLLQHRTLLKNNPRLSMMYKTLEKMGKDKISEIKADSQKFLDKLN